MDLISRSLSFCQKLVIAIGVNPGKNTMFSEDERVSFIKEATVGLNVNVVVFHGLLVDYAKSINAPLLIRGIRSVSDFEYEINLANVNKVLAPSIETVFLPTSPDLAVVSSSMVKEIAKHGGNITSFVPQCVVKPLFEKFGFVKYGD